MRYDKLLKWVEKYAQLVTKTGVSLWDLFKKLPPPDMTKFPGVQQGDDVFEVWASIVPGPKIAFRVNAQKLELLKSHDPSNEEIPRLNKVVTTLYKTLNTTYAPKMLAMVRQNLSQDEYRTLQQDGLTGEYMIWRLEL